MSLGKFPNAHRLVGDAAVETRCTCSPTAALTAAAETKSHADFGEELNAGGPPAAIRASVAPATKDVYRKGPIFQLLTDDCGRAERIRRVRPIGGNLAANAADRRSTRALVPALGLYRGSSGKRRSLRRRRDGCDSRPTSRAV